MSAIEDHEKDYNLGAWSAWTLQEMGNAVHYLELMERKLDIIISDLAVDVETGVLK